MMQQRPMLCLFILAASIAVGTGESDFEYEMGESGVSGASGESGTSGASGTWGASGTSQGSDAEQAKGSDAEQAKLASDMAALGTEFINDRLAKVSGSAVQMLSQLLLTFHTTVTECTRDQRQSSAILVEAMLLRARALLSPQPCV